MADLSNYLSALRNALQLGGVNPLPGALVERLYNSFSGPGSVTPAAASERPAPPGTAAAPAAAAPASAVRPMAAAPAPAPGPMPPAPAPAAAGQPQSLLDRLRQSTAASFENPGLQSAGDIGAGMLASRSPNFFTMLGSGLQAQRTGERERMQDLRQAASTEAEARYRDQTIRLKEAEDAYNRDPSNPQNILRLAQARYYTSGGAGGAGTRGQLTPAGLAQLRISARTRAIGALRNNIAATPADIDVLTEQYFNEALIAGGGGGTPAPAAPPSSVTPVPLTGPLPPAPAAR